MKRILQHFLFWLAYVVFHTLSFSQQNKNFLENFIAYGMYALVVMTAVYITLYMIMPRYFAAPKKTVWILIYIALCPVFLILYRLNIIFLVIPVVFPQHHGQYGLLSWGLLFHFFDIYPMVALAVAIKLFHQRVAQNEKTQRLEKEKLEAELNYLKNQIHPHFLFNTLNNLYALTLKKSDQAPEIVLTLSSLLDYMLYHCNEDRVLLSDEIDHLKNYLALEQLRYGKKLSIETNFDYIDTRCKIAPLLILPLVENAFKHGVSQSTTQPWIKIFIQGDRNEIGIRIQNSMPDKTSIVLSTTHGIGLKNVQRRLLLLYPHAHDWKIEEKEHIFTVHMTIQNEDIQDVSMPDRGR